MSNYFKIKYQIEGNKPGYLLGTYRIKDAFKEMDRLSRKLHSQKFVRMNPMLIQRGEERYFMEMLDK